MRLPNLRELGAGSMWLTSLMSNLLKNGHQEAEVPNHPNWEEEKEEILQRLNWLYDKVVVDDPLKLLDAMPSMLGQYYGAQWAIYSCTHLNCALRNISRIYPDMKEECLQKMPKVIDMILTPEIRAYDTKPWREDALETLSGNKSHMTYLSLLAWCITDYKLSGGTETRFYPVLHGCCEALNRRMLKQPDLCLLSFPNCPVFIPDMLFAIVALHNYSKLYNGMYADSVERWLDKAQDEFLHSGTGLLVAKLRTRGRNSKPISGAYTALSCYCLTQLPDERFALDQYKRMIRSLYHEASVMGTKLYGIREKLRSLPRFSFDPDAGPIVEGLSASGTAWAIGAATYFEDWKMRNTFLRTADLAGGTVNQKGTQHYRLGEIALVGEAVVLAMRTNKR